MAHPVPCAVLVCKVPEMSSMSGGSSWSCTVSTELSRTSGSHGPLNLLLDSSAPGPGLTTHRSVPHLPEPALLGNAWGDPLLTRYLWKLQARPEGAAIPPSQAATATRHAPQDTSTWYYLSISVHHKMSSFSFMKTGKCWSLPCFMEFDLVVMVLTLLN